MTSDNVHEQETMVNLPGSGSNGGGEASDDATPEGDGEFERLGKYSLLKLLGEGAMGAVYLAWDTELERHTAIKLPKFNSDKDPQLLLDRFRREARSAAALTHPGICPIYEFGEIGGQFFLAMAYIEGRSLEEYMARPDPIVPKQAATLLRRVAMALADAHDAGVMHRDLKPGNIMVNREARPVVMDFGLARQGEDTRLTQTGAFLGTPAYASPEQIKNASNDVDHRTDIYSLGVILYEMLAKRLPFVSGTVMGMVGEILTTDPDSPTVHRAEACPRLCRIALKAMRRDRATRYQSMHELAEDLGKYIESLGGTTSQPLQASRTGRAEPVVEPEARTELVPKLLPGEPASASGRSSARNRRSDTPGRSSTKLKRPDSEASGDSRRKASKRSKSNSKNRKSKHRDSGEESSRRSSLAAEAKRSSSGSSRNMKLPGKKKPAGQKSRSKKSKRGRSIGSMLVLPMMLLLAVGAIAGAVVGVSYLIQPTSGRVRFEIPNPPDGLSVLVDGDAVAATDLLSGIELPEGPHTLVASAVGFETMTGEFLVKPNEEELVTLDFTPPSPGEKTTEDLINEADERTFVSVYAPNEHQWGPWAAGAPIPARAPFASDRARGHQDAWAKHLDLPKEVNSKCGLKFVLIPPGEYDMGSHAETVKILSEDAAPNRELSLKSELPRKRVMVELPFYISTTEVTQQQYEFITKSNPAKFSSSSDDEDIRDLVGTDTRKYPVESITRSDAAQFCYALGIHDGEEYRLPNEREWEFAARAGTATKYWVGDKNADELHEIGWFKKRSESRPHRVGRRDANPFGLFDMLGNVREFVSDPWTTSYATDAATDGSLAVSRGGSWRESLQFARASDRGTHPVDSKASHVGFRIVRPIEGPEDNERQFTMPQLDLPTEDVGVLAMLGLSKEWTWGEPVPLTTLNTDRISAAPELSADGLELFFSGTGGRGNRGTIDILRSSRKTIASDWSKPASLGAKVCNRSLEGQPWLSPNGKILVFSSNRTGSDDLYRTVRSEPGESRWSAPERALILPMQASNPTFSRYGDVVFFESFQPNAKGSQPRFKNMVAFNNGSWKPADDADEVISGVPKSDWYVAQCLPDALLVGNSTGEISVHFGTPKTYWKGPRTAKNLPTMFQPTYCAAAKEIIFQRNAEEGRTELWSVKLQKKATDE